MLATPNLKGYWRFEGDASDSSGYSNDGTIYGATLGTGYQGRGYGFVTNDYIDCGTDSSLDIGNEMTISAWVYLNVNNTFQRVASIGEFDEGWIFGISNSGKIDFTLFAGGAVKAVYGDTTLSTSTWYHIAGTYSKTDEEVLIYLDGESDRAAYALASNVADNGDSFKIGKSKDGSFFNGNIDEVSIYSKALSPTDIKRIKMGQHPLNG